jgi:hypothetical protein
VTAALLRDPVLAGALHAAAALLLLTSALHKWRDPLRFRAALADYALLPRAVVPAAAAGIALAELAVGAACAIPATATAGCAAAAGLVALYTVAVAGNLLRGRRVVDCGCGGPGGPRPPSWGLVARNAAVVALLLVGALPASGRSLAWLDFVSMAGVFAWLAFAHAAVDVALANAAHTARLQEAA